MSLLQVGWLIGMGENGHFISAHSFRYSVGLSYAQLEARRCSLLVACLRERAAMVF